MSSVWGLERVPGEPTFGQVRLISQICCFFSSEFTLSILMLMGFHNTGCDSGFSLLIRSTSSKHTSSLSLNRIMASCSGLSQNFFSALPRV